MVKRYIETHVTEISAWAGVLLIASVFWGPRYLVISIGLVLMVVGDDTIKAQLEKVALWVRTKGEQIK